jgi:hypothetical protein
MKGAGVREVKLLGGNDKGAESDKTLRGEEGA